MMKVKAVKDTAAPATTSCFMSDEIIGSLQNTRIKSAIQLRRSRGRAKTDRILIDGRREIRRALESSVDVQELFYCTPMLRPDELARLVRQATSARVRCTEVTEEVMGRIRYGDRSDGVVATARRPVTALAALEAVAASLVAIVEGVEKPGNFGAIVRTADAAGVDAVIAADPATDILGPNSIRASLGTVFCLPVAEASVSQTLAWAGARSMQIVVAAPASRSRHTEVDFRGPTAIVLGSESQGCSDVWEGAGATLACVPMMGRADSLNVSVTAALFFYEAVRQRSPEV
jgi:TrmH family RNA methyltransferase